MKIFSDYYYLNIENVDTDLIIPKQFLNTIKKNGFSNCCFFDLKYFIINNNIKLNKDFILNKKKSKILISKKNFGCGSSREHAVWALTNFGIKIIIAESYSDIFYDNSMKNNLLLLSFDKNKINYLIKKCCYLYINIKYQYIKIKNKFLYFYINDFYKNIFEKNFSIVEFILKKKKKNFNV